MKNINFFVVVIFFTFLLISCNETQKDSSKRSDLIVSQWGQEKYLIYLPLYVAQEKGFFKDERLNVSIKFSGNDDQVFATVLKGEAQLGVGDPVFTAISREKGAKGKVIASIVDGVAIWGVTKNKSMNPIEKASDLAGLRIGTFPEPSTNFALMKKTLVKNGETLKNTRIIQAPIGSQLALLEKNNADIAMDLEPGTSIAESKGYKVVYSSPKFYGRFAFTGLTTTEEYLNGNKEIVQRFLNAIEKSLQYCHTNQLGTTKIAEKLFPKLEKTVVAKAVQRMITEKTIPEHAVMSDDSWQKAMQVRVDIGDLKTLKPTKDAVDNTFAIKAQKQ